VIMCYGGDTAFIRELVDEAVIHSMDQDKGLLGIYQVVGWLGAWVKTMTKKARSLDSVVLDTDISETLTKDILTFQSSGEWYMSKGVPYRRGYLLFGPPGTGKTSFVQAIAGALKLNLCYLNLSSDEINDDSLNRLLSDAPERSIILLEDIDAMFVQRDSGQVQKQKLSFSGFLNALDGVRSQEGQILFMTTNHKERLDPALLRPGRADVHVRLENASEKQIRGLFDRFFPNEKELSDRFAKSLPVNRISMAKLQGHLLIYRESAQLCVDRAGDLLKDDQQVQRGMTIDEWLHRLNLLHLKPHFDKQKLRRIEDMIIITDEGQIAEHNLANGDKLHSRRMWNMLAGEAEAKENFKYLTKHGIRSIGALFLERARDIEDLVA
jgi:mitochondrial chaperone BCS1